ncbi:Retrovirus-related Pol polyprotein from transposon TNT 1-94 [Durusdinium trenchii]|uniref:Retrovirus-related Pol polyprotein from transposon TNT 1-94 n=1 Tax=Durusdinium trenchii TaxID=1381693 RepID=A0ABP0JU36_9DINO
MKSALEEKLGKSIPDRHAIWTWLARHACFLISRYRVGPDGRTPYERLKGKRWRRPLVVFGERVHFRPLQSYVSGRSDLAPKLDMGVYVGTHGRNGDALVMTKEGVIKGGSLKRLTVEERWADVELFKGTPWKMRQKSEEDVEVAAVRIELPAAEGRLMPEPVARDSGPRNLYDLGAESVDGNRRGQGKGVEGSKAAPKVALADVPDEAEEMRAPDAVGQPQERVDPVGQPVPGSGTGRIDPVDRSTPPVSRAAEGATGDESPAKKGKYTTVKKAKVQSTRGSKRGGGDLDDLYGGEPLREGEIELERGPSSSSKGEAAVASPAKEQEEKVDESPMPAPVRQLVIETICNLELASFLNEKMFPEASFEECKNVSREMLHLGASRAHVAEIYNPERFTSRANQFGLSPGFAIDMELQKPNGEYWDLSKKADEEAMNRLLDRREPVCLIGSPPCGPFSPLQNLSKDKRTPEETERIRQEGLTHLRVACKSYLKQMNEGRIFLHEHPNGASSWKEPEMQMLINDPRVIQVEGPMCRWGMKATDQQGEGFVRKETRYLTNSVAIAAALSGQCNGGHRHVHLVNGRARQAQKYPPRMVAAILRAIRQELQWRGELNELSVEGAGPSPDGETNEPNNKFDAPAEDHEQAEYFDTVTGAPLRKEAVLAARQEELRWVHKQQIYVKDAQERIATILAKKFEFRVDGCVGPEESDGTVMSVLNRILEYNKSTGTLTYEADPRHAEIIVKQLQLEGAREVSTPSTKQTGEEAFIETPPLNHEQAKIYRSLVMRAAYLSLDRGDLCEASEYYAIVKATASVLGIREMFREWGVELDCMVLSDSSAARGMCSRRGLGKTRHVQTRYLWVQQKLKEKEFELVAVGTDKNVADLCTKPLSAETCWKHMHALGQFAKTGKSAAAKAVE